MNRLIVFDCDGTLVDSGANIVAAVGEAFELHGRTAPGAPECRRIIGLSLVEAIAALHPEGAAEEHLQLAETYKSCFFRARAEGRVAEPLYDGIAELIEALEADGWLLAVATGKSDRGLDHCLRGHSLRERFVSLQTSNRHPSKPHPSMVLQAMADAGAEPETTVVIGDTAFDIGMARAAGATAIGVAWGYHSPAELTEAGAHAVAETPLGVLDLLPQEWERRFG